MLVETATKEMQVEIHVGVRNPNRVSNSVIQKRVRGTREERDASKVCGGEKPIKWYDRWFAWERREEDSRVGILKRAEDRGEFRGDKSAHRRRTCSVLPRGPMGYSSKG